jgi:ribosomal protein S18 acetylase RimI-like enzyme
VARVVQSAFGEYRGRLRPESGALAETAETIAAAFRDHWVAVAERDGALVGAVLYTRRGEDIYLGRLSTSPECRGQGIASALVAHVEAHARSLGALAVTLGVRIALPENLRFFEALGYREVGRDTHASFDSPTSIRLAKRLASR